MGLRNKYLLIGFLCGFTGIIIGTGISMYFASRFISDATNSRYVAETVFQVAILDNIEKGDISGAKSILVNSIDGNILALDSSDMQVQYPQNTELEQAIKKYFQLKANKGIGK